MPFALILEDVGRKPLQLLVNQRNQPRQGFALTLTDFGQQRGYLAWLSHRMLERHCSCNSPPATTADHAGVRDVDGAVAPTS
jgi:hypothetical protein